MNTIHAPAKDENFTDMAAIELIKTLEARIAKLEGLTVDGSEDTEGEPIDQLSSSNTIFQVRKCDLREFKNRFSTDDGRHAVDVLVSGALIRQEEAEELKIRAKLSEYARDKVNSTMSSQKKVSRAENAAKEANMMVVRQIQAAQEKDLWIQRIRFQSPALLAILAKIQGETWSSRQRTYSRPFCTLLYFYPRMKEVLSNLQKKWGRDSDIASPAESIGEHSPEPVDDCPAALAALQCFVDFFEEEVFPDCHRFDNLDCHSDVSVRFDDLGYLFRAGDNLYRPSDNNAREDKRIWRAFYVRLPTVSLNSSGNDTQYQHQDQELETNDDFAFRVDAFYLDFNGEEFVTVAKSFSIVPYAGSRPITSLPIYPLRFAADAEARFEVATEAGERALHYISERHGTYNAWTVTRAPSGEPIVDAVTGATVLHAEHVNSEVMVDFSEAFQACPAWKPVHQVLRRQPVVQEVASDDFSILSWSNANRGKVLGQSNELVPLRTGVSAWQSNQYLHENSLLKAISNSHNHGKLMTAFLGREDRVLLTGRVFAYVFTERKFAQLNAMKLRPSSRNGDVLNSLRIPDEVKEIIQGSIKGHLLQKVAEKERGDGVQSLDLIQGKGTGLFILLHGVPGVGKTATAEAIAQFHGKPLFKIACGDLGLTPSEVEGNLRGIFRLAGLWDCILLLDEVDTFFSQRSKGDAAVNKNALVSVFLRVLDYYTGILFMTTNRAGALDEAFKSRIHYKIYYKPLSRQQTLEIWDVNIERLRRSEQGHSAVGFKHTAPMEMPERAEILRFALAQFDHFERHRRDGAVQWNGRQIRNAFQVARSLAYSDAHTEAETRRKSLGKEAVVVTPRPILKIRHFELMSDITADFDAYMRAVFNGQDDAGLQRELENRVDDFVSPLANTPQRHSHHGMHGFREPQTQPTNDSYRERGDSTGFPSGLGPTWRRRPSIPGNPDQAPSPPINLWGSMRSRPAGPAVENGGPPLTTENRSSSSWVPRESPWRRSQVETEDEQFRRPAARYGGDERDAGPGPLTPVTGFSVPSFDGADDADLSSPHPGRPRSGDYGNMAPLRRRGMAEGGLKDGTDYSDVKNQHGKRGRED